jgi:predicted ATPase
MIERTKKAWCEAEVYRTAGEIMLQAPKQDAAKAEVYFNHALTLARSQHAKSWELRVAMSGNLFATGFVCRATRDQKLQSSRFNVVCGQRPRRVHATNPRVGGCLYRHSIATFPSNWRYNVTW